MSPAEGDDSAVTTITAAAGIADFKLFCFRAHRIVAVMECLADAACMRRSSGGCPDQRTERAHERDEQQISGDPTMHTESDAIEA